MDKAEPEDKVILGNRRECGIQSDMGGAYYIGSIVDMQNLRRDTSFCPSDIANDKNGPSFQRFYPGIMYEQTAPA
jgi:hypothetical protein